MSILYIFFEALLLWLKIRKQKQGRGEMIQEAVRKTWKNLVIIIVAFLSRLYLIGLSMAFRHLQNIYQENSLFIYYKHGNFCRLFLRNIFAIHSSNFYFSIFFRELKLIAIRCYCPVSIHSAKRP